MSTTELTLDRLDAIQIPGSSGRIAGRVGLLATLYLKEPAEPAIRRALLERTHQYIDEHQAALKWVLPPEVKRWRKATSDTLTSSLDKARMTNPKKPLSFVVHSGEKQEDACHYAVRLLSPTPLIPGQFGFVSFYLPISWAAAHGGGGFQNEVLNWCRALKPFHGYAGLGVLRNPNYGVARKSEPYVFPLIQRFPGLEFDEPVNHAAECTEGIKSVNWLTILSDGFIDALGGITAVEDALEKNDLISKYLGGAMIQAGETPELGDLEQSIVPKHYQRVAQFLAPIRSEPPTTVITEGPEGVDMKAFAKQWWARFD